MEEQRSHIWLDSYLHCASIEDKCDLKNEFVVDIPREMSGTFNWKSFLDAGFPVFNVNFYPSIMMIAGAIAWFHYPYSIMLAGKCVTVS